ncbi:hypothetical protein [Nocardia sp. CY41]|uniref:hypothetical protein n=1 Tax=Nocardia sp. CY41 TaxID=2608686 RepID=UPI0013595A05|nr:hypothetical protein [Nocardia sp. CY41]
MTTVGEYFASTLIRGINEGINVPGVVQSMHGTPADGSLELPVGTDGPTGPDGPPAAAFRWEGDIADSAALNALATTLRPVHAGKAYRVLSTNTLMYWNGTSFDPFTEAFGGQGPDGQVNNITIGTVTTGAVGSDLIVTVTGTPPNLVLNLTVPRGIKGRKGDAGGPGPIRSAPDYQNGTHTQDMVPLWDTTANKWVPRPAPWWRGPWSINEGLSWNSTGAFVGSFTNSNTTPNTVAQLTVPAQDVAWRPFVTGGVTVSTVSTGSDTRIDAEVRIGSNSGQIVAIGAGLPYGVEWHNRLIPHFGSSAMTPGGSVGVIAAGTATTLHVVLRRNLGTGNYNYVQSKSNITCWAVPVSAP